MGARRSGQSRQARRLIRSFAKLPNVMGGHLATLERVIDASPLLTWQLNEAIRRDELSALDVLPAGSHAGGAYDGDLRTISIPLHMLTPASEPETAFVLGHEVQHALTNADARRQTEEFFHAAETAAHHDHDYTSTIESYLKSRRDDEAIAHLAGWNVFVEWVEQRIPNPTIEDIVLVNRSRAWDFVESQADSFVIKPLLTPRSDLRFDLTPSNVEAMAGYYFDKGPADVRLGFFGTSDYQNQYGSWAVMQAAACHRYFNQGRRTPPTMIINATRLGLSRKIMEENGIDLAGQPVQPYLDCSTSPPQLNFLHHTIETHHYVPDDQESPARPAPDPSVGVARRTFARAPTKTRTIPTERSTRRDRRTAPHPDRQQRSPPTR